MAKHSPKSVGLGGDGDEVAAIEGVERVFGVRLDYSDAPRWVTAGDVFDSLQKVSPPVLLNRPDIWKRFAAALCYETGVRPDRIDRDSPLLA